MFQARSANWRKLFDPETKFFRGKTSSGEWTTPFDPFTWGGPYTEGCAWQYRFNILHDPEGMMQSFGGTVPFVTALESMLTGSTALQRGHLPARDS